MHLISKLFYRSVLFLGLLFAATPALAQPGGYEPPPVDYADPTPAPAPAALARPGGYEPPSVDYADPGPTPAPAQAAPELLPAEAPPAAQGTRGPHRGGAHPRVDVGGYVELYQGIAGELADRSSLPGDDEVLTYTSVAAGVDGQIATRRVVANFGYRYERRLELSGNVPDEDVHEGIAQVRAQLAPGTLQVEAAGIATRTGGAGRAFGVTDREASEQVFAGYAGPTLTARSGPLEMSAFYRLAYVNVDDDSLAGDPSVDGNFDETIHMAGASAGVAPGPQPFGWNVSTGYVNERGGRFDNHFEGAFVRGDVLLPVNPALALSAGVGYSATRVSQSDVLRDANGVPLFDADGNLIPDPSGRRLSSYDQDGIFADAGFVWRPTPRSELQLRAGINDDGDPIVAGAASLRIGRFAGIGISIYDNDETFGQSLVRNLRNLPDDFRVQPDPLTGQFAAGCLFSPDEPGKGVCLSPALQRITDISFRARGGSLILSGGRRLWSYGAGITFARRDYYLPDDPFFASVFAPDDQDLAFFGSLSRQLGRTAAIGFDGFLSFYNIDAPGISDVVTVGGRTSFSRSFLFDRMQLIAALGLTYRSLSVDPDSLVGDATLGLRYSF